MGEDSIAVLLVEDSLADTALLMELLQESDAACWQVTHAKRMGQALEHLAIAEFDVVLLDLSLPDSQGLDTIAHVQAAVPHLPIVVLTGLQDKTLARQAVAQGAQDYLVKGQLSSELLLKTVSYAIERSHILKRLQESEQRFRGVFNQTFQWICLLNPDGLVLDINQGIREISSALNQALINTPIWEAPCWQLIERSQSWLKAAVLQAASQGETLRSELQACSPQGAEWWFDVSIKPLVSENGSITLLIVEGRDISKLKQAETEIRQALEQERELNQMKNNFIAMVSHEFRNPLTTIRFATRVLQDNRFPYEKKVKYFANLENATDQMLELLEEILLLGRTEAGKVEAEFDLLDLEQFCREIVEAFQYTQKNPYPILFSVQGSSTQGRADPSLLRHILENLLSNAIKYSPAGETVRFTLICQEHQAKFCIEDQGIGIPQQDQKKLFEAFHRAGNVCKIPGTGLGLAIVKRCVDLQHGEIYVESQEGTGSKFTVVLPLNLKAVEREKAAIG